MNFDPAGINYVPTTGVRRVQEKPLLAASDRTLEGYRCVVGVPARGSSCRSPHPSNIWHGAIVPLDNHAELLDWQGHIHARVSVDFAKEFGCYLAVLMRRPDR
jgi:hypothetical protein